MYEPCGYKTFGFQQLAFGLFLDCDSVIRGVIQKNPASDKSNSFIFFKTLGDRCKKRLRWIAIVVCERDNVSAGMGPSRVARVPYPWPLFHNGHQLVMESALELMND